MKARLSLGTDLKSGADSQVTFFKKDADTTVMRIDIELKKEYAVLWDDGKYTDPSQEPYFRDAALGELLKLELEAVIVRRIDNQNHCALKVSGTLGTKVPHTPG